MRTLLLFGLLAFVVPVGADGQIVNIDLTGSQSFQSGQDYWIGGQLGVSPPILPVRAHAGVQRHPGSGSPWVGEVGVGVSFPLVPAVLRVGAQGGAIVPETGGPGPFLSVTVRATALPGRPLGEIGVRSAPLSDERQLYARAGLSLFRF